MAGILKSRWLWAAAAAAALLGLYAFLGFRVAPGLLRSQLISQVRATYGRELAIGEVRVHPFKLQLEVRDVSFPDLDRQPMLALRRLFVDFEVASLWRGAWVFRDLSIDGPAVRAVLRADGALNLADLQPPPAPGEPAAAPGAPPALPSLWIESLSIRDGRVQYVEIAGRRRAFVREFSPVGFTLRDFRTTPEGGAFGLSARTGDDERFEWVGRFALAPVLASEGEFSIAGLRAAGVAEFLGDALPFDVSAGTIELAGRYRLSLGAAAELEASIPALSLASAALRARGVAEDWITVPSLQVAGTRLRWPGQALSIDAVTVRGLQARAWLDADGTVNLQRLFAVPPGPGATATAPASGAVPETRSDGSRPWTVAIGKVEVLEAAFDVEDRRAGARRAFRLAPLDLRVQDASLDLSRALPVSLDARVDDHATLRVSGQVVPQPLAAQLDVSLAQARMQMLQPFVLPVADLTIRGGTLGVTGRLRLDPPERDRPWLGFAGDVTIDGFASVDNTLRKDLVSFRRLELRRLRYTMAPDALDIDRIRVLAPYARVIISPEQVLNLSAVLDPAGAAAQVAARRAIAAARAAETPAARRARERDERRAARARQQVARRDARRGVVAAPEAPRAEESGMPIRIREVRIDGGRMNFSDLNVRPNFSAEILDLGGTITGLSSAFSSRASIDLKGRLDEFSPVTIGGTIQPFAFDRFTDVSMKFENISLPVLNPYSGQLAGYNIAKGKLTTELRYQVERRRLNAAHRIRIDQLEWGEATANRGEATLPVKFATSLLKDRNGVIQLDVPVTGTLDDPRLRIGPIVWQVIKNLIVKAVTAPFALLGALFAGAEDAQFVDFAPGSSELDAATLGRLDALAKGLAEKPAVSLDVPIGAAAALDAPALAERRYLAERDAALVGELRRKGGDAGPLPPFDSLPARQRIAVLRGTIAALGGEPPPLPEARAVAEGNSRAEARAQAEAAAIELLEKAARARAVPQPGELEALARARAAAIQRALLSGGTLEPSRVFLLASGKVGEQGGKVRVELGLK
ncbi:MAG: DUF748 domain-containing protein [Steroidobacteraceae bacterium]|nr:DUF748 domain-containing protein [Steroidobacteraceae bacterium]